MTEIEHDDEISLRPHIKDSRLSKFIGNGQVMEPKSHEELTFASLRAWHKRAVRGTMTVMCAVATRARDVTRVPNMRRAQVTHPAPLSRSAFHRSLARSLAALPFTRCNSS